MGLNWTILNVLSIPCVKKRRIKGFAYPRYEARVRFEYYVLNALLYHG